VPPYVRDLSRGREYAIATFTASVEPRERGGIAIKLPFDPNTEWGNKSVHRVTGTVAGIGVRGTLNLVGDDHYLELGPAWCRGARFDPGTPVQVALVPEGPQLATLDPELAKALEAEPAARQFFESLATFYRKGFVQWIEQAKRPETRARRIAETVEALKAGKKQRG
jgi:Bacteriocin-protection, YdeI or OmpD-Associated/Domain of unknown function (DUF1905)